MEYTTSTLDIATNGAAKKTGVKRYEIRVDQSRLEDMKVKEWMEVEAGSMTGIVAFLSRLLFDTQAGQYYEYNEAREIVGDWTMRQLKETADSVLSNVSETAVPKG